MGLARLRRNQQLATDRVHRTFLARIAFVQNLIQRFPPATESADALSFARANRIRELAATLPLDAIVLETDAPDIPPAWLAGGRNSPDQLPRITLAMAALRGLAVEDLAAATSANANAVLPRLARLH